MARNARTVGWLVWTALGASGWACSSGGGTPPPPPGTSCSTPAGQTVTLSAGAYTTRPPLPSAGCFIFPGNASTTDSAYYLLAGQLATDAEGATAAFILDGDTIHPALAASSENPLKASGLGVGERFHDFLRQQERSHYAGVSLAPQTAAPAPAVAPALLAGPPTVGSTRTFKVCSNLTCSATASVTATAKTVNGKMAIYVDNNAPANGLTQGALDTLGALFDTTLYAVDTAAYGRESDIDSNTVVIVLMTNVVNQLVTKTQCETQGFVAGFFFGADIDPQFAAQFNKGEIFYSIVADPDSTLSCAHSVSRLKSLVPVTFIHEFQHMISYNQHVLVRGGSPQVTWLDEGMSHFAEELGGRSFLPADNATFSNFVLGDLINAYQYLDSSATHFLAFSSGIGSLAERGAAWLLVRYLADQYAADTSFASIAAFTRSIELTSSVGATAISNAAGGTPFPQIVEQWALANYVSDLPGFAAPPELQYKSWHFRTTFASLNLQLPSVFKKPFPLTPPITAGTAVSLNGTLHAGSANYALAFQRPSAPGFDLLFSGPNGAALQGSLDPRLNIIRIR